ncbi:MAG: glutamine synthetase family protein [Elusimicrobiales bacterium]|nr:glutamine synthetase family protein [Elusimicrobiales bacterium]
MPKTASGNGEMDANRIARWLGKPPESFTKKDLLRFIAGNNIEVLNFRYVGGDGRLKTLGFVVSDLRHADRLLSTGERVDGSSLFSSIDAASSDLYVVPRYKTAYVNPFAEVPTVDMLCSYYNNMGERLSGSPENVIRNAQDELKRATGMALEAMGELEYYVLSGSEPHYPVTAQKGYHESMPFSKWERLRVDAMRAIAQAGGKIKYAHAEVGHIRADGAEMSQHEIEFLPVPAEDAADQLAVAKWVLQMTGHKYGVAVSFAPKISAGHAGSGLHIHTRLVKNGRNMMIDGKGISDAARRVIAGYLALAPSLTAFGNTVPTSYLRLVPHQEAPTNICWGDRNRSVLVRVPLGWRGAGNMAADANPQDPSVRGAGADSQTVEFRCADGSAQAHFLIAGLAVAARHGLEMPDALDVAKRLYVDVNIFKAEHRGVREKLPHLPVSCRESAEKLESDRDIYEKSGVFSPVVIDSTVARLKNYNDRDLSQRLFGKEEEIKKLVSEYLYC